MRSKILCLIICITVIVLCSCDMKEGSIGDKNDLSSIESDILVQLTKLQSTIEEYEKKNNEAFLEIQKLKNEIIKLKSNTNTENEEGTNASNNGTLSKYLYTVKDGVAIITGYTGKDKHIVIPSNIDGYEVEGIGESAFSYSKLSSVIISEGVKSIDWFAFYTIPTLISITVPQSVTEIGYSAFDGASSSFSIYCHEGTYIHDYAKSYGISYVII